jgi:putative component of membrane protein insertase Oxa1/YidC/SpoIIIJ protein YidD
MSVSTSVNSVENIATQIAIATLNTYQKHLSPHKGFSCPHRLLHGGVSCSEAIKQAFLHQRLSTALQTTPQRFKACRNAAKILQQQAGTGCIIIPCCIPL